LLSIITRLGEQQLRNLENICMSLEFQSNSSFEWILMIRPGAHHLRESVDSIISRFQIVKHQSKIIYADTDNRSSLLNIGLENCKGTYFSVLDDDDAILTNYVETLVCKVNVEESPKIRRAIGGLRELDAESGVSVSKVSLPWPLKFSFAQHVKSNQSPNFTIAFPISLRDEFHLTWNDNLEVVEDWDFLMNALEFYQVESIPVIVGLYQRSTSGFRSKKEVPENVWLQSEAYIRNRLQQANYIKATRIVHGVKDGLIHRFILQIIEKAKVKLRAKPNVVLFVRIIKKILRGN
jgi:glycosyltransferase involved in cell wall biosynthesis